MPVMSTWTFPSGAQGSQRLHARAFCFLFAAIVSCSFVQSILSQEPPPAPAAAPGRPAPPKLNSSAVLEHLEKVRREVENVRPGGPDVEILVKAAHFALNNASDKTKFKDYFGADRCIVAADAFRRAAEHPAHVTDRAKGPVPQAREIADHLQRVYFRLQQAEYFAGASGDPEAKFLPPLARKFYEDARKAFDAGNWFSADDYAKSADDTIRGLENLAQAAAPEPPPQLRQPPRRP